MAKRCLGCMETFGDEFQICPHCGYVVGTKAEEAIHIEPGTLLHDRYIIGKVLGYGGFGVTYIGWDGKLEQKVAIKEYLPGEFSTRMPGQTQVTVFNGEKSEQFHGGMNKFVDEAKRLAKFQNENGIVRIFDSFEENHTAYIIMECLEGETLAEYLKREKVIPEDEAVNIMLPVMESLQAVHAEGILHRDIAPDNIFLTKNGEVKLIDFGASRYATTSHSRSLTVIIKPGYSPEEQYRSRGDQGPHTDVYAIAATLYKMITGRTPSDAMERRVKYENQSKDILEDPHKINKDISLNRENAIMNALNVRIEDRTPDIATFMAELQADPPVKRRYGKIKKLDFYRWPLWLKICVPSVLSLLLVFGTLLLTGVIKFSLFTEEIIIPDGIVVTPNVEGMQRAEAIKTIEDGKLLAVADGAIESPYIPAGEIIIQNPVGGSYLETNGTVKLKISSGMGVEESVDGVSTIPLVLWETEDSAREKLKLAGLGEPIIDTAYDDSVPAGQIIDQSLEVGEKVAEGTVLTLTVSLGPKPFAIIDVSGKLVIDAKAELEALGLVVTLEYEKNDSVEENHVIRQSVQVGNQVKRGDSVSLTISSGATTVTVENVVGKNKDDARSVLEGQGFKVTLVENYSDTVPAGIVESQTPAANTNQMPGANVTIFVSKGKQALTVSFNANGGSVDTEIKEIYVNSPYGTLPTPTREGYTFRGWYTSKTGGVEINADTVVTEAYNHILYAKWRANEYKVSFDANGGKTSVSGTAILFGEEYGNLPIAEKKGSAFDGWFTSKDGGTRIESTTVFEQTNDITLFAHWTENAFNVSLNANGGKIGVNTLTAVYNSTYGQLPVPEREGYTFLGWFTAKTGGEQIKSDTKITATENYTIYAQWKANTYVLSFNANGGSAAESKTVTFGSAYGDLPASVRDGYSFMGWYANGTAVTKDSVHNVASDLTVEARWSTNQYVINFDCNGGTADISSKGIDFGEPYGGMPTPVKAGHTFNGWFDANGNQVTPETVHNTAGNVTVTAKWTVNVYTIYLDSDYTNVDSITVTYGQPVSGLPTPVWEGHTFGGWYCDSLGSHIKNGDVCYWDYDITLTEVCWVVNEYTVYLNPNGGSVSPSSIQVWYGYSYDELPTPTRDYYMFDGWYTSATGGTFVNYYTEHNVAGDITLYAHWSVNEYELKFNANGGSCYTTSKSIIYGSSYGSLPTPTRDYYTFDGWYTSASGGSKISSSTTMSSAGATVYAHWTLNSVSDWVLESQVPSGAEILDEKWTYTRTQTTESSSSSMSGWTQTGSRWVESGSGSAYYASFPSGYDTGNQYYKDFMSTAYSSYDNGSTKREVSNSWAGYVYWHWMYDCGGANASSSFRNIYYNTGYDYTSSMRGNNYNYKIFGAFTSTTNYSQQNSGESPAVDRNNGYQWYVVPTSDRYLFADTQGTRFWYRFDYYKSAYVDYTKYYTYQKVTSEESSTYISAGGEISNVQRYVKYRPK